MFLAQPLRADDTKNSPPEPKVSDYTAMAYERFIWMAESPGNRMLTLAPETMQIKWVLDDRLQTPENLYLAASQYSNHLIGSSKYPWVRSLCQQYPPKPDDYQYQANCVLAGEASIQEAAKRSQMIAETAFRQFPRRLIAWKIYNMLAIELFYKGHTHESIRFYQKAFETLPADAEAEIAESKVNLAFSYANSMLSTDMQRQSLVYYEEVLDWYRKQEPTDYNLGQIRWVSYNKAIAHLFFFAEYDLAWKALDEAEGYEVLAQDIKVFKAYALAKGKRVKEARSALKEIELNGYEDPERLPFLTCYVDLTRRLLGDPVSVQSCLNMKQSQTDVLLDLTDTLATLNLEPREENRMWRTFYNFFVKNMKPDFTNSLASAAAEAELQQEKAESRLKDLKLKNLALYQDLTFAMIVIVLVCGLALILAILFWRNSRRHALEMSAGKARLQHIIDNNEEGIITIRPGLVLEPEESQHLQKIIGKRDLRGRTMGELLAYTNLSTDTQAIAIQCLTAVMGENELAWELNQSNLPVEAQIGGHDIAFYWQPLLRRGQVHSVLLVIRDVTTIYALKKQSQKALEQADRMLGYAREILNSHPRAVAQFISELPKSMQDLRLVLHGNDRGSAGRIIHGLKGTARTLGLRDLQNQAHRVEDELKAQNEENLQTLLDGLSELAQTYAAAMQHVLGPIKEIGAGSLFDLVGQHRQGLERQLAEAGIRLGQLLVDESMALTQAELQTLAEVILHGLTNAADHGFIIPKRQGKKVPDARFLISVYRDGEASVLILRDHGVGINHQKIQEAAGRRGWAPGPNQIWSDFLFLEGVSTADALTMTSGRGVGLTAIHRVAGALQGRVQLLDNDQGPGSILRLVWPAARDIAA